MVRGREAKKLVSFYNTLSSSSFCSDDISFFFNNIRHLIPHIDDEFTQSRDADIILNALNEAVEGLSLNKSPGSDGLASFQFI